MSLHCIDLFAGLGGFSEGARQAGAQVLWAANHWPAAVATHALNHPDTLHTCQDLQQANWAQVPAHDLLLASPACQGHSQARGRDLPHHDGDRATAYAVLAAACHHRPRFVLVENVRGFLRWPGFRGWRVSLEDFGYHVTIQLLNAADFGLPQSRERVFVLGCLDGPVHLTAPGIPHTPAAEVIDWAWPRWSPIARPGRASDTLARIEAGRRQWGDRFLVAYYGSERGGRPLSGPVGTITTRDRFALIDGDRMRMLALHEVRAAMGFRADYRLPGPCRDAQGRELSAHKAGVYMLGNAVPPPMAAELVRQIGAVA